MPTYYFLVSLVFLLVNFGYAFARLGDGEERFVSPILVIVSALSGFILLRWIRRRLIAMDRREDQPR